MCPKVILLRCVKYVAIILLLNAYINVSLVKKVLTSAFSYWAVFVLSGRNNRYESLLRFVKDFKYDIILGIANSVIVYELVQTINYFIEKLVRHHEEAMIKKEFREWLRKNVEQNPQKYRKKTKRQIISEFVKNYKQ